MKVLIIGGGNMGRTYAESFVKMNIVEESNIMILEREERRNAVPSCPGKYFYSPEHCFSIADLVIIAVKPQDWPSLSTSIRPYVESQQVFLSIMAGISIERIQEHIPTTKVVRAMPNLPAQVGHGMTVFMSSSGITRMEKVLVENILKTTGATLEVEKQQLIDASTAVSGSGPAYVYYFINAVAKAAEKLGFSKGEAELLATKTFFGASNLLSVNDFSCEEWIQKVSSKGGTTEAALNSFAIEEVDSRIKKGLFAAFDRAEELGK